jgi:hypothetical protein
LVARKATSAAGGGEILDGLLAARPDQRDALRSYVQRAKALRNECGCAMSGAFLTAAIVVFITQFVFFRNVHRMPLLGEVPAGVAFVFVAGLIGKALGVGVARLRLALLYRGLRIRYRGEGV